MKGKTVAIAKTALMKDLRALIEEARFAVDVSRTLSSPASPGSESWAQ